MFGSLKDTGNSSHRKSASKQRASQPEMEEFLLTLSHQLIEADPTDPDPVIQSAMEEIAGRCQADRSYIYWIKNDGTQLELMYAFNAKGIPKKIKEHDKVDSEDFNWLMQSLQNQVLINIATPGQLPAKASTIKIIMEVEKTKSMLISPLFVKDMLQGFIGLDAVLEERQWPAVNEDLLSRSGAFLAAAVKRKHDLILAFQRNGKLSSLLTGIEDMIFISTPSGKILETNPAGAKILGYASVDELLKINIEKDLYADPKDRKRIKRLLAKKGRIKDYELHLKRKDGQEITVLETSTVVRDAHDKIIAYEGIIRDITENRRLEQQLFQSQKMESIGLLAGGIAHDFNNILTAIKGYGEMIMMQIDKGHPLHPYVSNILKSSKRAENLIKQLLGFSRKQFIRPRVLNINDEIRDLNKMLGRLISEDIQFELNLTEGVGNIKADPVQLQQILVNLVVNSGNAIRLARDSQNPKIISITTDKIHLDKEFSDQHPGSHEGDFILIIVRDTGIGMNEETKQKIFEPFFTTKGEGKGTGLGLSTVYGIVKQNDGSIFVESEPGKGSTFKIYWPATKEEKESDVKSDSEVQFAPRSETIMVVEDDEGVRDLACTSLRSFGYTVIEAINGQHALNLIQEKNLSQKIDLLFTDMIMPEMGGDELARNVHEMNPKIKILLSSGYTESRMYFGEADQETGYFMLNKPYSIKKLEKKIRYILNN